MNLMVKSIEGFNIILFEEVANEAKIFIAVSNKEANAEIEHKILAIHPEGLIVRYKDLPEEAFEFLNSYKYSL